MFVLYLLGTSEASGAPYWPTLYGDLPYWLVDEHGLPFDVAPGKRYNICTRVLYYRLLRRVQVRQSQRH